MTGSASGASIWGGEEKPELSAIVSAPVYCHYRATWPRHDWGGFADFEERTIHLLKNDCSSIRRSISGLRIGPFAAARAWEILAHEQAHIFWSGPEHEGPNGAYCLGYKHAYRLANAAGVRAALVARIKTINLPSVVERCGDALDY